MVLAEGGEGHLVTLPRACAALATATEHGRATALVGELADPAVATTVSALRAAAPAIREVASTPAPWRDGATSVEVAVLGGRGDVVTDLLERGGRRTRSDRWIWRRANEHGHVGVLRALRDAGVKAPRSVRRPPSTMPDAVVTQAPVPRVLWWLVAAMVVLGIVAMIATRHVVGLALFVVPVLPALVGVHLVMRNTAAAFDGPLVARRSGRGWHGPIDLTELVALGYATQAQARVPALWLLGQRQDGARYGAFQRRGFDPSQDAEVKALDLRFVTLYAKQGFGSPGIEANLRQFVEAAQLSVVGPAAAPRVWPNGTRPAPS